MILRHWRYRFLPRVVERLRIRLDDFARNLVGPSTVIADASSRIIDISLGHSQAFAIVKRLDSCQDICMLLYQIRQVGKVAASGAGIHFSPFAFKGLAGSRDGDVDILLGGFMDGDDGFLIGGIDGFERLAVDAFDPFVVDESRFEAVSAINWWGTG